MDTETDEKYLYTQRLINRLRRHYVERMTVPSQDSEVLSFQLLQQLCQYIINEGYGE